MCAMVRGNTKMRNGAPMSVLCSLCPSRSARRDYRNKEQEDMAQANDSPDCFMHTLSKWFVAC